LAVVYKEHYIYTYVNLLDPAAVNVMKSYRNIPTAPDPFFHCGGTCTKILPKRAILRPFKDNTFLLDTSNGNDIWMAA
jgi:hypothetical protein